MNSNQAKSIFGLPTRWKALCLSCALLFSLTLGMNRPSLAEDSALEQLLEIFENRGLVSPSEAQKVRRTLKEEKERLKKKENELVEREKALEERERRLTEREERLEQEKKAINLGEGATEVSEATADGRSQGDAKDVEAQADRIPLKIEYRDGFCIGTEDEENPVTLCLGGLLQADYRYYNYGDEDPAKDGFDIRRARLLLSGQATRLFSYKFEYEFQGAQSRNLLDAYVDAHASPYVSLRMGQYKEPFGLEQSTKDKNIFFAERSMGYYLTPRRDLGVMAHASVLKDRITYGIGLFNGDGLDDSTGGDVDSPEVTGRVVFAPFRNGGEPLLNAFQFGGSFSHAGIDRNNVDIHILTTGLTPFFDVASRAKFRIIREVGDLTRYGTEIAWAYGPFALMGEWIRVNFSDVETSADQFDIELEDYYIAFLLNITGEEPTFKEGILQPVKPRKGILEGGWGGLGLAFRYDRFEADESVYEYLIERGVSVRKAEAYSFALNWYLNRYARLIVDFTRTDFDSPLLIYRDPLTGDAIYSDYEHVLTGRFQFQF